MEITKIKHAQAVLSILISAAILFYIPNVYGEEQSSLQRLIDEARPGDTVILREGIYYGPVMVDKPLRIVGIGFPVIDGRGVGDVIVVNSSDVVIEGLKIVNTDDWYGSDAAAVKVYGDRVVIRNNIMENVLYGVYLINSYDSLVKNNTIIGMVDKKLNDRGHGIYLWYSFNATIIGNKVSDTKDGIYNDHSYNCRIIDNIVLRARYGIHLMYSSGFEIAHNRLYRNLVGMALMYSRDLNVYDNVIHENRGVAVSEGIFLREAGDVYIRNNIIYGHLTGIDITYTPYPPATTQLYVERNLIAFNYIGISIDSDSRGYFIENSLVENMQQVELIGSGMPPAIWRGNYWSDYMGTGKTMHRVQDPLEDMLTKYPSLRAFAYSPAFLTLEVMKKAFPLEARVKAVDENPSVKPLHKLDGNNQQGLSWLMAAILLTSLPVSMVVAMNRRKSGKVL